MDAAMSRSHQCAKHPVGSATGDHLGIRWVAVDIEMCDGDSRMLRAALFETVEVDIRGQSIQTVKKAMRWNLLRGSEATRRYR